MKWKIFQWMKFLFRHSSNSRKLSRQKFHNELACVFTAHYASKNADWNQPIFFFTAVGTTTTNGWRRFGLSEQRRSSELFSIQSEKSPDSSFFACDLWKKCIMPSSRKEITEIKGEGMIAGYIQWVCSDQGGQKCRGAVKNLFTTPPSLWIWYIHWLSSLGFESWRCIQ